MYRVFSSPNDPLCCPFVATPASSLPLLLLNPWESLVCSLFHNFVISGMLYKWNQTVSNLWGWAFVTQSSSLEIYPDQQCIYFYCWVVLHVLFSHSLVEGHLGYFQFEALKNKTGIQTFVYRFWMNISLPFFG